MKKKLVTLMLFMCMTLVTGCAKSETPVEKIENFELNTSLSSNDDVKQEQTTNLLDDFLAGKISADGNGLYVTDTLHISELQMDEEEWDSYHIGERLDLDNDGEDEQILTGPYGGMYLDARDGAVKIFANGESTVSNLSYTYCDDEIWIVHSDTMHLGRAYYIFDKYKGADTIVESVTLELYEEDGTTKYYGDGVEISEQEYQELYQRYLGNQDV